MIDHSMDYYISANSLYNCLQTESFMKEILYLRSRNFFSFTDMIRQLFIQTTIMCHIAMFRSTTDHIYDGGPIS